MRTNPDAFARAYGCDQDTAEDILQRGVLRARHFHDAIVGLGPIRVWFRKDWNRWSLDQKTSSRDEIIREWQRVRQGRAA